MLERGFRVDFDAATLAELSALAPSSQTATDLTHWPWISIDNDDTRDLDQLTCVRASEERHSLSVAVADVSSWVSKDSKIDRAAAQNTTSVYSGVTVFPMLPENLSTDKTSLHEGGNRLAVVVEMEILPQGEIASSRVFWARVKNQARLTYPAVTAFLSGRGKEDLSDVSAGAWQRIASDAALQSHLRQHDRLTAALRQQREAKGSLYLDLGESRPTLLADGSISLAQEKTNRAREIIEDCMVAANQAVDQFLETRQTLSLERVVEAPKRWDRLQVLARQKGAALPPEPDGPSLQRFMAQERARHPEQYADLSLAVVKLLGRGRYVVVEAGQHSPGHFGLGVSSYSHATAPNRRFPDLLTQRLVLAALRAETCPYTPEEAAVIADHCTAREDDARKVERTVRKSMAALALERRIGETFDAIVTGAAEKGTWVRLRTMPVEGRLNVPHGKVDVGDAVTVRLVSTDPQRGYLDFSLQG